MALLIHIPSAAEYIQETLPQTAWHGHPDSSPLNTVLPTKGATALIDGSYTTGVGANWLEYRAYAIDYGFPDAVSPTSIKVWNKHGSSTSTGYFSVSHRNIAVYSSNDGRNWTLVNTYAGPGFVDTLLGYTSFTCGGLNGSARFWKVRNQGSSNIANQAGHTFECSDLQPNVSDPLTPTNELLAHWTMDDVSGGFVNEEQNQFHAEIQSAPSQDAGDKKVGTHSMNFVRTNSDYLDVLHSRAFNLTTNGRSVAFWMKPATVAPSLYGIIQKGGTDDNGNFKEWQIYIDNGELFAEMVDYTGATVRKEKLNTTITAGEWVHIAVSFTGITSEDEIKIWKNKVQGNTFVDKNPAKTIDPTIYKKHNVNVGRFRKAGSLYYYDGKLDDIRFYGKDINQIDVNQLPGF